MAIHDWSRVDAGLFHHFHLSWIATLCQALNAGLLPPGFSALAEQVAAGPIPDVLTLHRPAHLASQSAASAGAAVAVVAPRSRYVQRIANDPYAAKANRIAIRHPLGQVVAIIEIVSPGNKSSRHALSAFITKVAEFLNQGIHVLVVDLLPPSARDPQGIHGAIWDALGEEPFELPTDKRLTLATYSASLTIVAYVEPVAVGDILPDMPLFLEPELYVPTPLEATYQTTWAVCPTAFKDAVLGRSSPDEV